MFGKKIKKETFDRASERPVIRSSICTGEKVAGFKDVNTGVFRDVMLIRDNKDMEDFLKKYDISRDEIRNEW